MLTLHFLELQPTRSIIKSAENHINEREVARLYQDSFNNNWWDRKMSFNDQLDKFYVERLETRYESWKFHEIPAWNNNYFCTKRLTSTESTAFSESFQSQEEMRFAKRLEKVEQKFQQEVSILEKRAAQTKSKKVLKKLAKCRGNKAASKSSKTKKSLRNILNSWIIKYFMEVV